MYRAGSPRRSRREQLGQVRRSSLQSPRPSACGERSSGSSSPRAPTAQPGAANDSETLSVRSLRNTTTSTGPAQAPLLADVLYAQRQLDVEDLLRSGAPPRLSPVGRRQRRREVHASPVGSDLRLLESKAVACRPHQRSLVSGGNELSQRIRSAATLRSASAAGAGLDRSRRNDRGSAGQRARASSRRGQARPLLGSIVVGPDPLDSL
jgi:hypothetical protein